MIQLISIYAYCKTSLYLTYYSTYYNSLVNQEHDNQIVFQILEDDVPIKYISTKSILHTIKSLRI